MHCFVAGGRVFRRTCPVNFRQAYRAVCRTVCRSSRYGQNQFILNQRSQLQPTFAYQQGVDIIRQTLGLIRTRNDREPGLDVNRLAKGAKTTLTLQRQIGFYLNHDNRPTIRIQLERQDKRRLAFRGSQKRRKTWQLCQWHLAVIDLAQRTQAHRIGEVGQQRQHKRGIV